METKMLQGVKCLRCKSQQTLTYALSEVLHRFHCSDCDWTHNLSLPDIKNHLAGTPGEDFFVYPEDLESDFEVEADMRGWILD